MSKHIKQKKMQFSALSLLAVSGIMVGMLGMQEIGAHKFLMRKVEASENLAPGLSRAVVAPDVSYEPGGQRLLPPITAGERADSVPVLLYHGIVPKRDRFSMTPSTFREQLFALKREGFTSITLKQYLAFREGADLPPRAFLLTFDDGRTDSYVQADPVLKATGFTAVMFAAGDASLGAYPEDHNAYYLTGLDLREMVNSGRWEIGSHALQQTGGQIPIDGDGKRGNFLSNRMWLAAGRLESVEEYATRIKKELVESRVRIEDALGVPVNGFSYPYGDFGQQQVNNPNAEEIVADIVRTTYPVAFRQVWDKDNMTKTNSRQDEPLRQKRIEVPTGYTGEQLIRALARVLDKPLPFDDGFAVDTGWRPTWGTSSASDGALVLKANEMTTGADALLDGTYHWTDYAYTAKVDWISGARFTLIGRYQNENNYLQCVFGGGRARLDRVINGKATVVSEGRNGLDVSARGTTVGMRMHGTDVQCMVGDTIVAQGGAPAAAGAIGFKVWDPEKNQAELRVTHVQAKRTE